MWKKIEKGRYLVPAHSKCIFIMLKKHNHILYKFSANLLIVASVLCVLFGNGTHVHTVFDQFSDHGDMHVYMHSHHADTNHDHKSDFDGKDDHQHSTATVDLDGTLSQKTVYKVLTDQNIFTESGEIPSIYSMKELNPLYLDLPPPDFLILPEYFYSSSLRGPPIG